MRHFKTAKGFIKSSYQAMLFVRLQKRFQRICIPQRSVQMKFSTLLCNIVEIIHSFNVSTLNGAENLCAFQIHFQARRLIIAVGNF